MSIEQNSKPSGLEELIKLDLLLGEAYRKEGLVLEPDYDFGGLTPDSFGYNVDDSKRGVNLGFLQVLFDPRGFTVLVPQNDLGKQSITAFCNALGRDPEGMQLMEITINYAMYQSYFPYVLQ